MQVSFITRHPRAFMGLCNPHGARVPSSGVPGLPGAFGDPGEEVQLANLGTFEKLLSFSTVFVDANATRAGSHAIPLTLNYRSSVPRPGSRAFYCFPRRSVPTCEKSDPPPVLPWGPPCRCAWDGMRLETGVGLLAEAGIWWRRRTQPQATF